MRTNHFRLVGIVLLALIFSACAGIITPAPEVGEPAALTDATNVPSEAPPVETDAPAEPAGEEASPIRGRTRR